VSALRILPVAPFTLVNLAAGASPLSVRAYLLGTAFALAPLTGAIVLLSDRARRAIVDPTFWSFAALSALLAAVWIALAWARRRVAPRPPPA
jgi:phospholipase D1/2